MRLGLSKRLTVVLSLVFAVIAGPALAAWDSFSVNPKEATANSIYDTFGKWTDDDETVDTITVVMMVDGLVARPVWQSWVEPKDDGKGYKREFRMSVSHGLDLKRNDPPDDAFLMYLPGGNPVGGMPDDPKGIAARAAIANDPKYLFDPYFVNRLFFSNGLPMGYIASLFAIGGAPTSWSLSLRAHVTFKAPADGSPPPDAKDVDSPAISVKVHDSSPKSPMAGKDDVDYGGRVSNCDFLSAYPGENWPATFGPDPLISSQPSIIVPRNDNTPDDGASSDTYEFRVVYRNIDNLPPRPWLPGWADELDAPMPYGRGIMPPDPDLEETGVVLYFDYFDVLDLGPDHRQEGFRPHFMRRETVGDVKYNQGVTYYYKMAPHMFPWMQGQGMPMQMGDPFYAPTIQRSNEYIALMTGTYHYFYGCSDDYLYWQVDDITRVYLGENQPQPQMWAQFDDMSKNQTRSSTFLDPSWPQNVPDSDPKATGPFKDRPAGRRPSSSGLTAVSDRIGPKDNTIYVDRANHMPGCFQNGDYYLYNNPASMHPTVSCALVGYPGNEANGFGRFMGTLAPYYRGVNPIVDSPSTGRGFGYEANRAETCMVTSSTAVTLKIRYYQADGNAPVWIKAYVGDGSFKIINPYEPLTPENGGFTGYTMQPSAVQDSYSGQSQVSPYNYQLGVDYEYRIQLPAGPHMYFFMAYDGKHYALFPARPEKYQYISEYDDWWVPGYQQGETNLFDNNYFPGPYVNTRAELTNSSVTPTTGAQGQSYDFRVTYKDADGQRPYLSNIYIETGSPNAGDNGIIKGEMVREDPLSGDFITGVTYIFRLGTKESESMAKGIRHYRFEFSDDWGRQNDPNDYVRGEQAKLPSNGGWFEGPTIGDDYAPTLRNGSAVASDGASNTATTWTFSVAYKDLNNTAPKMVAVYLGKLSEDGQSINWDSGHDMLKTDSSDKVYSDGCNYYYQTKLAGATGPGDYAPIYYYAFGATDGSNWATWVPTSYPDQNAWSESAGCLLKDNLTPSADDPTITFTTSKQFLVGTLATQPAGNPIANRVFVDPIVYKYTGGDITKAPTVMTRDDNYVAMGMAQNRWNVKRSDFTEDPAYQPAMYDVLGVYLNPELTGTDYYHTSDGNPGSYDPVNNALRCAQELPLGQGFVWIKYHHKGDYTLDRIAGKVTFADAQDPADVFKADYFFATKLDSPITSNQLPILANSKLTPTVGSSSSDFVYTVNYKETEGLNGQAPAYIKVVIDGTQRDMTPVVTGNPSYRSGITYKYTAKLGSGSHNYYFVTSDGAGQVTLPPADIATGNITPIAGPWVNDPPVLTAGTVTPNPSSDTISTEQSVVYSVVYTDTDGDAPVNYQPFASDSTVSAAVKDMTFNTPLLYVDNAEETWNVGTVDELVPDTLRPDIYRSIKVLDSYGNPPTYAVDQFAGKLIQFMSGSLAGRVYLITSNSPDTLKIAIDDLGTEGLEVGTTFSIGVLQMSKADVSQQNYAGGVAYAISIPMMAEGKHKFHFKAAQNPPAWAAITGWQSSWVRFPASGESNGPNVAPKSPDTNRAPVLSMTTGDASVSPASGKMADAYRFYITYADEDNNPPMLHDSNIFGYIRLVFNDGSYASDMYPVEAETGVDFYKSPRRFTVNAQGLPGGTHRFHFEASDGWLKARWPSLVQGTDPTANDSVVSVNTKGVLSNAIITPPTGTTSSSFNLSVVYTDADSQAPQRVWVEIDGVGATMTRSGVANYSAGVVYTLTKSQLASGTHTVLFKSTDNAGETTSLTGTPIVVSLNQNAPVFVVSSESPQVFNIIRPAEVNGAATGGTSNSFRYKVTYRDVDGNAPLVDQNGIITEGIRLFVDGKLETVLGPSQRVGDDFAAGVVYQYDRLGSKYQAGAHTFQFKATDNTTDASHAIQTAVIDGPTIVAATIGLVCEAYDTATQSWVVRDPKVTETMRINGSLTGSAGKPIPSGQTLNVTITRPDGTGESFTVKTDTNNQFSVERVPMINKTWTILFRWEGTSDYKPAISQDIKVAVKGPTRVLATQDMSLPSTSAPAVDMVCMPMISPNKDAGSLFGLDRASLMQIVRWDPVQKTYLRYGETYFPALEAGSAVWINPNSMYPSETYDAVNPPYQVDPEIVVNPTLKYRLLKPFGTLWDTTRDCDITIHAGWNQMGTPFLTSSAISGIKVTYQGKTVSLEQAASSGWIRNYLWMWDSTTQSYKLIHATRPDAYSKTLDPWRGYWIRSFVECTLTVPGTYSLPATAAVAANATAAAHALSASPMATGALPALDNPPSAPSSAGK